MFVRLLVLPSQIYRLSLDWSNLKYMIYSIQKSDFQNLAFLIPKDNLVGLLPKMMVFASKIEENIKLEKYL